MSGSDKENLARQPYFLRSREEKGKIPAQTLVPRDQPTPACTLSGTLAQEDAATHAAQSSNTDSTLAFALAPTASMSTEKESVSRAEFLQTSNKIIDKLDLLSSDISAMRKEIGEVRALVADLEATTADSSARLTKIENESLPHMKEEYKRLESELREKMLALEIHDRKTNLLLYGIKQERGENVFGVAKQIFNDLGISRDIPLVNIHRLPRRAPQGYDQHQAGPDPIIIRFRSMIDRDVVFNAYQQRVKQMARKDGVRSPNDPPLAYPLLRIMTDLPAQMKRQRYLLEKEAFKLRKEQNKATRIKLLGAKLRLQVREKGSQAEWKDVSC